MLHGADSFILHVKSEDVYEDLAGDVETRFDTLNQEVKKPILIGKNKKATGSMKDELGGKWTREVIASILKMYTCITDEGLMKRKQRAQKSVRSNGKKNSRTPKTALRIPTKV